MDASFETAVVFLLGYPGMGKRTVGQSLAELIDGVLVDNQLINRPLLELFRWDGKEPIPTEIWRRVLPIREAVLGTIEDLAPKTNSYVFTNVLTDDAESLDHYDRVRSLAERRGSLFLAVMPQTCCSRRRARCCTSTPRPRRPWRTPPASTGRWSNVVCGHVRQSRRRGLMPL